MALQTKSISANGSNGHHKFTLNINEDSTNIANNNSAISWTFVLSPIGNGYNWAYSSTKPVEYTVTVNGTATTGVIYNYDGKSTVTVKSGSATIPHNADGSKSISFSFSVTSINQSYLPGSASASSTMALTAIPRAATIVSAPNFTDGENPTITYSNPAGNAVTSLKACISYTGADDVPYRDIPKTGSSYTFTLTAAERATLRAGVTSGTTKTVKFYVTTVIGGQTYYSTLTKTFSLANTALPTLNPVIVDTNERATEITGSNTKFIRYFSNASFTANAAANQGATITSISVKNGSQTAEGNTGIIYGIDSDTFEFYVTDSRGNKASVAKPVDLIPYTRLTCSAKLTPPGANGNATYTVSGQYFNGSLGSMNNVLSVSFYYREAGTDSWKSFAINSATLEGDSYSASGTLTGLDYKATYECYAIALDRLMTVQTIPFSVTGKPAFDWGKDDFHFAVDVNFDYQKQIQGTMYDGTQIEAINFNGAYGDLRIGTGYIDNGKDTMIFGKEVRVIADDGLTINGMQLAKNKVLWSGGLLMGNGANAALSESISDQANGIVLVFSLYRNNAPEDVSLNSFFISKEEVRLFPGKPHTFLMGINAGFSTIAAKYIYIYDSALIGDTSNTSSGSNSGITFNNSMFVLRYVIGV